MHKHKNTASGTRVSSDGFNARKTKNLAMNFKQNNDLLENIMNKDKGGQRPTTGKSTFSRISVNNDFMLENFSRQRLNVKRELREKVDPKVQGERTYHFIQQAKNLATFDRIKRLALFDDKFLEDPNGDKHLQYSPI